MKKLTNDTVRNLPAGPSGDAIYPDSDPRNGVPGLYLRVRDGGSRTFIIQWRQGQFQRRATIGKVGVLSLDEARKAARKALVGIDEGNDPVAVRAKSRADGKLIFETVAREYLDFHAKEMKPGSLDQCTAPPFEILQAAAPAGHRQDRPRDNCGRIAGHRQEERPRAGRSGAKHPLCDVRLVRR